MKVTCLALLLLASSARAIRLSDGAATGGIAEVVTMLKDMLKTSQDGWKDDRDRYMKFKTYCEENTDTKTSDIQEGTKTIALHKNKIEELQGSNGDLSVKVAKLKADMAANQDARDSADSLRDKQNKAFKAEKEDSETAMAQMDEAIKILGDIGADQTMSAGADTKQFMAKGALLTVQSSVRKALTAASYFLEPKEQAKVTAFIQAPFTGTYTSQSGQIVGILKNMKDTFKANLEQATETEGKDKEAHEKFIGNKQGEYDDMESSYDEKQGTLGSNDGTLSTKKEQKTTAETKKDDDETFLETLTVQCKDAAKVYEVRKKFATNEEIAYNKALSILDNDQVGDKFSKVDATKFIQLSSRRHPADSRRTVAARLLQKAVKIQHSGRISQVLLLLEAGNPFTVVLEQITKMIKMADEEQKVDDNEQAWCKETNTEQEKLDGEKQDELNQNEQDIADAKEAIGKAESGGLKKDIKDAEDSLKTNLESQKDETDTRRTDNIEYQKTVHNMEECVEAIQKAEATLSDFYKTLDNEQIGLIQTKDEPDSFEFNNDIQNEQGKKVLDLLKGIRESTVDEANTEHTAENEGQHDYEDSMKVLTDEEENLKDSIIKLNKQLTNKEKELKNLFQEQTQLEKEKTTIERYMEKIKPGCDFVLEKYEDRKTARAAEKKALNTAETKLKGSPSFKKAEDDAKMAGFGKCKAKCVADEAGAKCKACLAGVSVPGYCAGHAGAAGC